MAPGELLGRWCRMLASWPATGAAVEAAGSDLIARYGEHHRRYHTAEHLAEVLAMLGDLVDLAPDPVAVELAAWFHDAVYQPAAAGGTNEAASAEFAATVLGPLGVSDATIGAVRRLIGLTVDHHVDAADIDGAVLVDADLWILASPRSRYRRYAGDVRSEYGHIDDDAWARGRSAVLAGFLGRPRLFATDRAHDALDRGARANLRWELATLVGRQP